MYVRLSPGAKCFTAVEEVLNTDTGLLEPEFTYGCLPPEESGLMQVRMARRVDPKAQHTIVLYVLLLVLPIVPGTSGAPPQSHIHRLLLRRRPVQLAPLAHVRPHHDGRRALGPGRRERRQRAPTPGGLHHIRLSLPG